MPICISNGHMVHDSGRSRLCFKTLCHGMQGTQMDREMFGGRFYVPSASLALFNILTIVGLIPVYDRLFVPLLHRFGRKLTLLQRIGMQRIGYELACAVPRCQAATVTLRSACCIAAQAD